MNTSTLFTRGTIPAQLGHAQDSLTSESVENGLRALGFRKSSPGYRAIETPVTPLDKAFQIYALHLAHANQYGHEPYDHDTMWDKRDAAWRAAASWLMETQDVFKTMDKATTRKVAKILPEAVRIQCSLELPPGSWEQFPRDGMKRGSEMNALTDTLQRMGLNIKVHQQSIAAGDPPIPGRALPLDYGTLQSMLDGLVLAHHSRSEPNAWFSLGETHGFPS